MAKKIKKLLALVLTIAMVLSFMSVGALAVEGETSGDEPTTDTVSSVKEALDLTAVSEASGEGWTWAENTLTLNGVTIDASNDDVAASAIRLPDGATIVVNGVNNIHASDDQSGIICAGALTIQGDGTLNVSCKYGIYANTIEIENIALNIDAAVRGIYAYNAAGDATVELTKVSGTIVGGSYAGIITDCEYSGANSSCVLDGCDLTVISNATMTDNRCRRSGIAVYSGMPSVVCTMEIKNSVVDATGYDAGLGMNSYANGAATATMLIENSTVTSTATSSGWAGIFASTIGNTEDDICIITIKDSNVSAKGVGLGIMTSANCGVSEVNIDDSSVMVSGGTAGIRVRNNGSGAKTATFTNNAMLVVAGQPANAIDEGTYILADTSKIVTATKGAITDNGDGTYAIAKESEVTAEYAAETLNYTFYMQAGGIGGNGYEEREIWGYDTAVCEIVETGKEYFTLTEAVADANALDTATIKMLRSIDFDSTSALSVKESLTIIGEHTISRGTYKGTMFTIPKGASLTLDGGLVIDGSNNWAFDKTTYDADMTSRTVIATEDSDKWFTVDANAPVATGFIITTSGGTVNMSNVTVQNNYSVSSGVIKMSADSTVNLNKGCNITHCASTQGNGLVVHAEAARGVINVYDGVKIDGNHVGSNHGLFKIYSGATLNLKGGTIRNTTGWNSNGVVIGLYGKGSTLNMTGGTICSNGSVAGPQNGRSASVYLHANSTMKMTGGTICHNMGGSRGGIDTRAGIDAPTLDINRVDQEFDANGVYAGENFEDAYNPNNHPRIIDNVSLLGNSTHDVGYSQNYGTWWVTGGIYTQDVDEFCARGYVCIPYEDTVRTDDYIVVPGYRVSYYAVTTQTVTDPETNTESTETVTTLVNKEVIPLPSDKFYYEVVLYAEPFSYVDSENGITIDEWYTEITLENKYDFSTGLTNDIDLYGEFKNLPTYTVTYMNGTTELQKSEGLYSGTAIPGYTGSTPTKTSDGPYTYTFSGWTLTTGTADGTNVGSTDLVYEAQFTANRIPTTPVGPTVIPDDTPPLGDIPEIFSTDHFAYIIGREDGKVHPEAKITRAEVATIFFRLLSDEFREEVITYENDFSDVKKGDWYNTAISTMTEIGILEGYPDGTFKPNNFITRAEFAAIAARFDPEGSTEGDFFSDIAGHWAEDEIIIAANNGWVEGDNGKFRPKDYISRAEAMTLVNRVLHRLPEDPSDLHEDMIKWPDNMDEDAWYYLAVQEATNSHYYDRKKEIYETWTELRDPRDWSLIEKEAEDTAE